MYHLSEYGEHREVSSPRFSPPSPPSGPMWLLSFAIISKGQVTHVFWLVSTHELLKDRLLDDVTINNILLRCRIIQNRKVPLYRVSDQKQITADVKMWLEHQSRTQLCCVCHFFFYLPFFDLICVLLLNRSTATWNLFVYPLALKSD